jgi:hypothetical protein
MDKAFLLLIAMLVIMCFNNRAQHPLEIKPSDCFSSVVAGHVKKHNSSSVLQANF